MPMSLTLGVANGALSVGSIDSMTFKENKKPKGRPGEHKHKFGGFFLFGKNFECWEDMKALAIN
jgi:hypothetical protein